MTTPANAVDLVGGAAVIGGEVGPGMDIVKIIRRGLPDLGAVDPVLDSGRLTLAEIDQIVLPRKTLANRRRLGDLTPEQSDRLIRVARVLAAAEEFGDKKGRVYGYAAQHGYSAVNVRFIFSILTRAPVRSRPSSDASAME